MYQYNEVMIMSQKSIMVNEETHRQAKILSAKTGIPIGEIVELLLMGATEKDIIKLSEKRK
jgi:hypothetical protein